MSQKTSSDLLILNALAISPKKGVGRGCAAQELIHHNSGPLFAQIPSQGHSGSLPSPSPGPRGDGGLSIFASPVHPLSPLAHLHVHMKNIRV